MAIGFGGWATLSNATGGFLFSLKYGIINSEMYDTVTTTVQDAPTALNEPVYATMSQRFCAYLLDSILIGLVVGLLPRQFSLPVAFHAEPLVQLLANTLWTALFPGWSFRPRVLCCTDL